MDILQEDDERAVAEIRKEASEARKAQGEGTALIL